MVISDQRVWFRSSPQTKWDPPPETNVCGQLSSVKGRGQTLDGLPGCGSTRKSGIKEGDNWQLVPELPRVPLIEIHPLITATSEQTAQSHVV